jgi:hypothetical protein
VKVTLILPLRMFADILRVELCSRTIPHDLTPLIDNALVDSHPGSYQSAYVQQTMVMSSGMYMYPTGQGNSGFNAGGSCTSYFREGTAYSLGPAVSPYTPTMPLPVPQLSYRPDTTAQP